MNKSEFITLIEHPENLEKVHIQALKGIITDFPYMQHAHSILAKALFNQKHYEFEKQLKYTALMVPNREVLYSYIHDLQPDLSQAEVSVLPEISLPVAISTETEIIVSIEEPTIDSLTQETQAVVEVIKEVVEEKTAEPIIAETPQVDAPVAELSFFEWLNYTSKKELIEEPSIKATEKEKTREPVPQSETIKSLEDIVEPIIIENTESIKKPVEEIISANAPADKSNINQFDNILDKFIRENPSISRPKSAFYSPMNMAKQSAEEDEELVTETLANIYYKQGHYKKAIRAYEKLCLIYPHKMAYFATLIQKIKTENKD